MVKLNTVIQGDCLEVVKSLPDESINSVITSPPYWQLRDYGYPEQWGLEPTYQEYLNHLWSLMDEIWRVLKDDGTVWVNLGDTYSTFRGKSGSGAQSFERVKTGSHKVTVKEVVDRPNKNNLEKCLLLIPHRFAIGCIDRGWILRNDIIWAKRNGMPESVTDRFSKKHEYFFFMVKQPKYYFDLDGVRTPYTEKIDRWGGEHKRGYCKTKYKDGNIAIPERERNMRPNPNGKNPGDVSDFWDIPTKPSSEKHYATFNTDLIDKPIVAGSPEEGIILDPFCGTGTTLARALQLNRNVIGIDGSKEYCEIANKRIQNELAQLKLAI